MMAMHWYPDMRRRFERPLLDHYHAELVARRVRGYDRRALNRRLPPVRVVADHHPGMAGGQ